MFTNKLVFFALVYSIVEWVYCDRQDCYDIGLQVFEQGVSSKSIKEIVDRHNFYRQAIVDGVIPGQPKGINMRFMNWDDELAKSAQEVANTCSTTHVTVIDDRWRLPIGQNIGEQYLEYYIPNKGNWTKVLDGWFKEVTEYKYDKFGDDFQNTGHYTQLIWADSQYVGCGYNSHDNPDRENDQGVQEIYVCHYGPRGNIMWKHPYKMASDNSRKTHYRVADY